MIEKLIIKTYSSFYFVFGAFNKENWDNLYERVDDLIGDEFLENDCSKIVAKETIKSLGKNFFKFSMIFLSILIISLLILNSFFSIPKGIIVFTIVVFAVINIYLEQFRVPYLIKEFENYLDDVEKTLKLEEEEIRKENENNKRIRKITKQREENERRQEQQEKEQKICYAGACKQ